MVDRSCICHSCGRQVEFSQEELPCNVLCGWLMVSCFKGLESVDRYSFCSPSCLKRWVDSKVPPVPEVFLESLGKDGNE